MTYPPLYDNAENYNDSIAPEVTKHLNNLRIQTAGTSKTFPGNENMRHNDYELLADTSNSYSNFRVTQKMECCGRLWTITDYVSLVIPDLSLHTKLVHPQH
jgi:hypothetical protein